MGGTLGGAGAGGLSDLIALAFPITAGDSSIPNQKNNDQPTVEALLKEQVKSSPGWNSAAAAGFAGLPAGLPMVAGIIAKVAEQFTGLPISQWLDMWTSNPVVGNLGTVVQDALGSIFTVSTNIQSLLGSLNFLDGSFDPATAIQDFINIMLLPSNLIAGLISGFLPTSIIPGLDASKIISGQFLISQITNLATMLGGFGTGTSIISQILGVLPGATGGLTGLTGLGSFWTDALGLLGHPTGLGGGSPTLPGIGAIPILGGLFSGGSLLTSLIPGIDASKIITGAFPISMITNLATMLGGFGTGSSIITQILGLVPNLASGTTGLTGLGDVFIDLFGALGSPTNVGSTGTLTFPGISSIPVLGGLLSGGSILGSLIPTLDASKIGTGSFAISRITNLSTMLTGFGTGTSILSQILGTIPNLASGTTGLTGLGDVFTDLFGALGNPTNVGSTGVFTLPGITSIPLLGGLLSGGSILGSLIPGIDGSKITSGTVGDSFTSIPTLLGNLFGGITGTSGSGATHSQVLGVVTDQSDVIAAQAAAIQALQSTNDAASTDGVLALETFEYVNATGLDSNWDTPVYLEGSSTQGVIAVANGHDAGWEGGTSGNATEFVRHVGTNFHTLTDYQKVSVVIATKMTGSAELHIYCRVSDDKQSWVRFNLSATGVGKIEYRNAGGAITQLGSTVTGLVNPPVGAIVSIEAGTAGNIRTYRGTINDLPKVPATDGSTLTNVGASFRGHGMGQRRVGSGIPGKFRQYSAVDTANVQIRGCTMRVYRASTGSTSTVSGDQFLPATTFDTVDYITPNLSWNSSTNEITVSESGTYMMSMRLQGNQDLGMGTENWYELWYINGVLKARGLEKTSVSVNGFGVPATTRDRVVGGDTFTYYVAAGGKIRAGFHSSGTVNMNPTGDAAGTQTWLTCTKIGET